MSNIEINEIENRLLKIKQNTGIKFSFYNIRKMQDGLTLIKLIKVNEFLNLIEQERANWGYKTIDGTIVKSQQEMLFANCLAINNIKFKYNHEIVNMRYDFKVLNNNDQYIYRGSGSIRVMY